MREGNADPCCSGVSQLSDECQVDSPVHRSLFSLLFTGRIGDLISNSGFELSIKWRIAGRQSALLKSPNRLLGHLHCFCYLSLRTPSWRSKRLPHPSPSGRSCAEAPSSGTLGSLIEGPEQNGSRVLAPVVRDLQWSSTKLFPETAGTAHVH